MQWELVEQDMYPLSGDIHTWDCRYGFKSLYFGWFDM